MKQILQVQNTFSISILFNLILSCMLLASCSDTIQQHPEPTPFINPNRILDNPHQPSTEPSNPAGGLLLYQKRGGDPSGLEKDELTRKNSLAPIDYQSQSVANIDMTTTYQTALDVLNLVGSNDNTRYYKEGMSITWGSNQLPEIIQIRNSYQGSMDFGSWMGEEKRLRKIGQSFADQFNIGEKDILQDEKAKNFIVSLYKYLENANIDCLEKGLCDFVSYNDELIIFTLPKMKLLFGADERRALLQIQFIRNRLYQYNESYACFSRSFDLLTTQFYCSDSDPQQNIALGDPYGLIFQN